MKLKNILIVVKDIEKSKQFYHDLFGLDMLLDNGGNIILTEGLVLQDEKLWNDFLQKDIIPENNSCELYFEEYDIEAFAEKLEKLYPSIKYVNRLMTHSWGQKVIRFYDLDGNLIEVGTPCDEIKRCKWCNLKNEKYIKYHDEEWCKPNFDDKYLFEMLILESFQAGLSWECILNKREAFRIAYDDFELDKICVYDENKINELLANPQIIRNRLKIKASISNARIFKAIQEEYGTFYNYLCKFTNNKIIHEIDKTTSDLSDNISKDLQKRGMKFVGSTIIYSYLQAIGVIYSHDKECYLYKDIE